ncbi:hypothetical protein VTK73DRAFT_249 [Phialemonium thermophilum]|uniref:Uncharacterized protein n=1 Tax=Phialemonium thermophilum TaxID=223376 RepID=A0ABR3VW64_9PEZI
MAKVTCRTNSGIHHPSHHQKEKETCESTDNTVPGIEKQLHLNAIPSAYTGLFRYQTGLLRLLYGLFVLSVHLVLWTCVAVPLCHPAWPSTRFRGSLVVSSIPVVEERPPRRPTPPTTKPFPWIWREPRWLFVCDSVPSPCGVPIRANAPRPPPPGLVAGSRFSDHLGSWSGLVS